MRVPWAAAVLGAALLFAAFAIVRGHQAGAVEVLANGGFESWDGPGQPSGWGASGQVDQVLSPSIAGSAARLTGNASLIQVVPVPAGATYDARVEAMAESGAVTGTLALVFLDSGFLELGPPISATRQLEGNFATLAVSAPAPGSAAWVQVRLATSALSADAAAVFDSASLDEAAGPAPTPTETFTPTPTNEPTNTRVPTRTPTPTRVPGQGTPTGGDDECPPDLSRPQGELLQNRDFSLALEGEPCHWDNFGGIFAWSANGGVDDSASASLISLTSSVKWVFQVVPVEPGAWYEASALARITSGAGQAWIDILWYPTADGSGQNIGATESDPATSNTFARLDTGPFRAPGAARTARFRLMLDGAAASAAFDEASFARVAGLPGSHRRTIPGVGCDSCAPHTPEAESGAATALLRFEGPSVRPHAAGQAATPDDVRRLPIVRGEERRDYLPWIMLGLGVALAVFVAPEAWAWARRRIPRGSRNGR